MPHQFRHKLRLLTFVAVLFSLTGGPFGMETMLPASGPGMTLLLLVVIGPLLFGLPLILAVSELASAIPVEGGYYRWVERSQGRFWAFQAGWWHWLAGLLDQALYPVFIVAVINQFFPVDLDAHVVEIGGYSFRWLRWGICMSVIVPFTLINIRGVQWVGLTAIVLDILIVAPYLLFTALAIAQYPHNPFLPLMPPGQEVIDTLGYGLLVVMWNYSGYESSSSVSEEIENPSQSLWRSLFTSFPLEIAGYAVPVTAALMVRDDWQTWIEGSFVDIAQGVGEIVPGGGIVLAFLITVASLAGCVSIFNSGLLLGTRVPFVMAEDRLLPRSLARLHPRYDTPWVVILFNASFCSLLVTMPFQELLVVEVWLMLPAYLLIYVALWVIRLKEPELPRPFRIPGGLWGLVVVSVPPMVLGVVALWVSIHEVLDNRDPQLIWAGLLAVASGPVAYGIARLVGDND